LAPASVEGKLVAVGATPVHDAHHDAHAYAASGLAEQLTQIDTAADLDYVGVDGTSTSTAPAAAPTMATR
jgi:hypothetical protein